MQKKMNKTIGWVLVTILIVIAGSLFLLRGTPLSEHSSKQQENIDAFTGTWRGEGTTKDGYKWFVVYTFKNGTYTMTSDSSTKDHGTYVITKKFEDGSIQMTKTSAVFKKTYDVFNTFADNGTTLIIEGMKLYRQK